MTNKMLRILARLYALSSIAAITSAAPISGLDRPDEVRETITHVTDLLSGASFSSIPVDLKRGERLVARVSAQWTVRSGDTGNKIAAQVGVKFLQLAFMNPSVHWRFLQIGQALTIPGGGRGGSHTYIVVADDTGNSIAAANGITFAQLDAYNRNIDWDNLHVDQTLIVPSLTASPGPSPVMNITRISQLPSIKQAELDADMPATDPDLPTVPIIDDDVEVISNAKEMSLSLTPGEISSSSSRSSSLTLETRQAPGVSPVTPSTSVGISTGTSTSTSTGTKYTIKSGDTGIDIAGRLGISFDTLNQTNPDVSWNYLQIGALLSIPVGIQTPTATVISPIILSATTAAKSIVSLSPVALQPGVSAYVTYSGSAISATPPYPFISTWMPFAQLWITNSVNIGTTCVFASGSVSPNTAEETTWLREAILTVSSETKVHPAFVLAMIMQESNGCVRVPTTISPDGIPNPGLMQSFNGTTSCNSNGQVQQVCSSSMIKGMIMDGVTGSQMGVIVALQTAADRSGTVWPLTGSAGAQVNANQNAQVQEVNTETQVTGNGDLSTNTTPPTIKLMDEALLYYQAARIYNSGSLSADGDLSAPTLSTRCYASDMVNRLMGWNGVSRTCSLH